MYASFSLPDSNFGPRARFTRLVRKSKSAAAAVTAAGNSSEARGRFRCARRAPACYLVCAQNCTSGQRGQGECPPTNRRPPPPADLHQPHPTPHGITALPSTAMPPPPARNHQLGVPDAAPPKPATTTSLTPTPAATAPGRCRCRRLCTSRAPPSQPSPVWWLLQPPPVGSCRSLHLDLRHLGTVCPVQLVLPQDSVSRRYRPTAAAADGARRGCAGAGGSRCPCTQSRWCLARTERCGSVPLAQEPSAAQRQHAAAKVADDPWSAQMVVLKRLYDSWPAYPPFQELKKLNC